METGYLEYPFRQDRILIGSGYECDLCLSEIENVSRRHLIIFRSAEGWFLKDRGSYHGTTLNGTELIPHVPAPLRENDRIVLARVVTIVFRIKRAGEAPPGQDDGMEPCVTLLISGGDCDGIHTDSARISTSPESVFVLDVSRSMHSESSRVTDSERLSDLSMDSPGSHVLQDISVPPSPKTSGRKKNRRAMHMDLPKNKNRERGSFWFFRNTKNRRSPQADDIQFRAAAPAALNRGEYFLVKLMAYPEADYARADREQMTLADHVRAATSSIFQANYMDTFRILIRSQDFPMEEKLLTLTWNGKYASAETDIFLPADYTGEQLRLTARVYSDIRVLTDLILILQVQAPQQQEIQCEKCPVRTAFVSYASKDLDKVLPRIQGLLLGQQDMDVFLDRKDLIRGERWEPRLYREIEARDIFYLFWSNNARNSPWVQRELDYAIRKKGLMSIEPVPLEDPTICPPPEQLRDRHFNDWTLRFMTRQ